MPDQGSSGNGQTPDPVHQLVIQYDEANDTLQVLWPSNNHVLGVGMLGMAFVRLIEQRAKGPQESSRILRPVGMPKMK